VAGMWHALAYVDMYIQHKYALRPHSTDISKVCLKAS
jgi:hypothetical protein